MVLAGFFSIIGMLTGFFTNDCLVGISKKQKNTSARVTISIKPFIKMIFY